MFDNNSDFIPRTYSVKSFRRREGRGIIKTLIYLACGLLSIIALGVVFLSMNQLA